MVKLVKKTAIVLILLFTCLAMSAWFVSLFPGAPLAYRAHVVVQIPAEAAWQKLGDLSLAHHYVPGIERTEIISANREGIGAARHVFDAESGYIIETVTAWQAGQGFTLALTNEGGGAPAPFQQASFSYALIPGEADGSVITTELEFVMAGGLAGEWLGRTLLASAFQQRVDEVAAGLKAYYEGSLQAAPRL